MCDKGKLSQSIWTFSGFGATYGLWHAIQWWMQARRKHQQEIYHYVERIIEYLSSQQQTSGETAYVPVIHVRDQLIPPQSRESKNSFCAMRSVYSTECFTEKNTSLLLFCFSILYKILLTPICAIQLNNPVSQLN